MYFEVEFGLSFEGVDVVVEVPGIVSVVIVIGAVLDLVVRSDAQVMLFAEVFNRLSARHFLHQLLYPQ